MSGKDNSNKNKATAWVIVLLTIILFAVTAPKTIESFGESNSKYHKVNNYLLFSTCSASYQYGTVWKVHKIGVVFTKTCL